MPHSVSKSPSESPPSNPSSHLSAGGRTIFLDRDGCLNVERGHVRDPAELSIYPGAGIALGSLRRAGFSLVVVSNQSAIGRGWCTAADVEGVNRELERQLRAEDADAVLDRIFICPHHPDEGCPCRKPRTGMIVGASSQHPAGTGWPFDKYSSWMVGDKLIDIELGLALGLAGSRCILVETGHGAREKTLVQEKFKEAVSIASDVTEAAERILAAPRPESASSEKG